VIDAPASPFDQRSETRKIDMGESYRTSMRLILSGVASILLATAALAGEVRPYSADAFTAAQADNALIVVHVVADWCPTCHVQRSIVQSFAADPANPDLLVFEIDFDGDKNVLRQFDVRFQSTLIAFRGSKERARSVGVTNPNAVADLIATTE
jgi:thioredoxin 1